MLYHRTFCVRAARSGARISASFVLAGFGTRAFRVGGAFGPTARGPADVVGQAGANRRPAVHPAV